MSKRRFIVPAFFYFDVDEHDFAHQPSEIELYDLMVRTVDGIAGIAQDAANRELNQRVFPRFLTRQSNSGLLLDDSPTFEVDAQGEVPYSLRDMWRQNLINWLKTDEG